MATMKSSGWVASTGINYLDGDRDVRLEVGQAVPASLVMENAWLVEQGWVASVASASVPEADPNLIVDPVATAAPTEAEDGAVSR